MDRQTAGRNGLPYQYSCLFPCTILKVIHTETKKLMVLEDFNATSHRCSSRNHSKVSKCNTQRQDIIIFNPLDTPKIINIPI